MSTPASAIACLAAAHSATPRSNSSVPASAGPAP
jgi:hypothetical protein